MKYGVENIERDNYAETVKITSLPSPSVNRVFFEQGGDIIMMTETQAVKLKDMLIKIFED